MKQAIALAIGIIGCTITLPALAQNVGIGISIPTARLHINGPVKIEGSNMLELGAGVAGKEVNAGKIGYNIFSTDALTFVGAGTNAANRKVFFFAEGGAYFNGPLAVEGNTSMNNLNVGGRLTTLATGAPHLLPVCYGTVDGITGTKLSGTGNFAVSKFGTGRWAIIIEGINLTDNNHTAIVTCQRRSVSDGAFFWTFAGISPATPPTGSLWVNSSNGDQVFSFVVYLSN